MTANLDENIKRLMKAGFVKVEKKTYEDKSIFIFFYGKLWFMADNYREWLDMMKIYINWDDKILNYRLDKISALPINQ